MRKSKKAAAETHASIVESSLRQFKSNGIAATGISEIMGAVGLTNGGFYKHFESKDQLVSEAVKISSDALIDRLQDLLKNESGQSGLAAITKDYLSAAHRDDQAGGCPIAGIGSELSRVNNDARDSATECIKRFISVVRDQMDDPASAESRARATAAVSMLVGAVTLSRIANEEKLSKELLKSASKCVAELNS